MMDFSSNLIVVYFLIVLFVRTIRNLLLMSYGYPVAMIASSF